MADFGLKIENSSGHVNIDSSYENLVLRDKKSRSTSNNTTSSNYVSFSGRDLPVAVMGDTGGAYAGIKWTQKTGNEYRYQVIAEPGHTIDYYAFDTPGDPGNLEYGLKVWNASGVPVFNSSYPYLRIVDVINVSTKGQTLSRTYSHPIGVVLNRSWQRAVLVPRPGVFTPNYLATGVKISGNRLDTRGIFLGSQGGADNASWQETVPLLIVDLTSIN